MTNEIIELMNKTDFNNGAVKSAYEDLINRDPAANIGDFGKATDARIAEYKDQYGKTYTDGALKEGIRAIIQEEKERAEQAIQQAAQSQVEKRNLIVETANRALNESDNLSSDEITKRVYYNSQMTNELNMKIDSIRTVTDLRVLLSEYLEAAKYDKYKAHAINNNLYLFKNAIKQLADFEQDYALVSFSTFKNEIDDIVTPPKLKVYRKLKEEMDRYATDGGGAARLTMRLTLDKYKNEYGI
ncbi:hypothetical protein [Macrococcus bovicus]|uniref:Uncharacterized protein n=1 Tax=Macrococcus bovicus TaxID=69968 RepID=A0A4R6C2V5_9STAP|nr:hypothetical protein [Macrococcus bovicus]TDM15608.1 hypothetical protein ERX55_01500 [Macrococcus bovicus]